MPSPNSLWQVAHVLGEHRPAVGHVRPPSVRVRRAEVPSSTSSIRAVALLRRRADLAPGLFQPGRQCLIIERQHLPGGQDGHVGPRHSPGLDRVEQLRRPRPSARPSGSARRRPSRPAVKLRRTRLQEELRRGVSTPEKAASARIGGPADGRVGQARLCRSLGTRSGSFRRASSSYRCGAIAGRRAGLRVGDACVFRSATAFGHCRTPRPVRLGPGADLGAESLPRPGSGYSFASTRPARRTSRTPASASWTPARRTGSCCAAQCLASIEVLRQEGFQPVRPLVGRGTPATDQIPRGDVPG